MTAVKESTRNDLISTIDHFLSTHFDGDEFEHRDTAIEMLLFIEQRGFVIGLAGRPA